MEVRDPERVGGRLVLVPGRDPLRTAGGSESYVVAHAKAAILAGYEPHVFTVAPRSSLLETDFGFLHRVGSPVRPPRSITSVLQRPWLVPPIVRFLAGLPGPHLIHGFGAWTDTALVSCKSLGHRGIDAIPVATAYVAVAHEASPKLHGTVVKESPLWHPLHLLELLWVRTVTARVERRAYRSTSALVVNYESVRSLLELAYGSGLPIRRLPYSPPHSPSRSTSR